MKQMSKNKLQVPAQENKVSRRSLIKWTVPMLSVVSLPAHAVCSEGITINGECIKFDTLDPNAAPVVTASVKCTLDTSTGEFVGQSIIEISSDAGRLLVNNLTVTGLGPNDTVDIPETPLIVDSANAVQISWDGQSTDGITCAPLNNFTIDINYGSSDMSQNMFTTQILDLLL